MKTIYEPKGKAREYSPLALNLYLRCNHGCKYCYAASIMRDRDFASIAAPRKGVIDALAKELAKDAPKEQVLLSFIGDVYAETVDDNKTTRAALELLMEHRVPVAILTKAGKRCLKDLDIFKDFGSHIQVGATLTFYDDDKSCEWEPNAALPIERLEMLKTLHDAGVPTFVSMEPVIDAEESLKLIRATLEDDSVDIYKIGKLNNYRGLDKLVDWEDFLTRALEMIRPAKKRVYVKADLRRAAPGVMLYGNEVLMDDFFVS